MTYTKHFSTLQTNQSQPIPGSQQVKNSAGGYTYQVDCFQQLRRFLILGAAGGSYYASEKDLTVSNAQCLMECLAIDPARTVEMIAQVSEQGLAIRQDPAVFALAVCCSDKTAKPLAMAAVERVCRTGSHLLMFVSNLKHFTKMGGPVVRRGLRNWYNGKSPKDVAYQTAKYASRHAWTHRDVLRLTKPVPASEGHSRVFGWVCGKGVSSEPGYYAESPLLEGIERAKSAEKVGDIVSLIEDYNLPREVIPTKWLNQPAVWEAMLPGMPYMAMIRNLGKMTSVGLLKPFSDASKLVAERLKDGERIRKSRLHPMSIYIALRQYGMGHGSLGKLRWEPVQRILESLDSAYTQAFATVEPTGKRMLLGLDVSGSMSCQSAVSGVSCREATALMAMATVRSEEQTHTMAFTGSFASFPMSKAESLDSVVHRMGRMDFGRTDCAQPMVWALQMNIPVDVFVVYTDNETWCGAIHPTQALRKYRDKMGINAKLVVCAFTATKFSIADPADPGMLDIAGLSSDTPAVISAFAGM